METTVENHYTESALMEVDLAQHISIGLKRLDNFLRTVNDSNPESLILIVNFLIEKYEEFISIPNLEIECLDCTILSGYPKLREKAAGYLLALLKPPIFKSPPQSFKVSVYVNDRLKSVYFFMYNMSLSLTTIMSKDEAINYFQAFIDKETISARNPNDFLENLRMIWDQNEKFQATFQSHSFINFKISDDVLGSKVTKCKWYEVMKELNDPELCYAVACHYDIEAARNMNPKFVLTRKKTLMQGDDCCDFCYHDTRTVESITHPSEQFWNDLR
ncbi:MAG: L-2-amino-thiazoline-4-carboxylic acid hydrolase [Candidatus Hodarchaeales archaeon]|jgi:hypothetical protein